MNLKNLTDPEIRNTLRAMMNVKETSVGDTRELLTLVKQRSLTRRDKQRASELITKYRYQSNLDKFQA